MSHCDSGSRQRSPGIEASAAGRCLAVQGTGRGLPPADGWKKGLPFLNRPEPARHLGARLRPAARVTRTPPCRAASAEGRSVSRRHPWLSARRRGQRRGPSGGRMAGAGRINAAHPIHRPDARHGRPRRGRATGSAHRPLRHGAHPWLPCRAAFQPSRRWAEQTPLTQPTQRSTARARGLCASPCVRAVGEMLGRCKGAAINPREFHGRRGAGD